MRNVSRAAAGLATLITLTVGAAACADDGGGAAPPTPATTSAPATSNSPTTPPPAGTPVEDVVVVQVEIRDGRVHPSPDRRVRVEKGQTVRIELTSDQADEVHVHTYDLEVAVGAGGSATLEFEADIAGQFEVESHELDPGLLFTLQVR